MSIELSITSDYVASTGCPEPYLKLAAEAGFTHVHWCHQWNTDFVYGGPEIDAIAGWLDDYGLKLLDLHATAGREKNWGSLREYERRAGVELVENRIEMTARLGGDAVVMHIPQGICEGDRIEEHWSQLAKSLDALRPCAERSGVRIAVENGGGRDNWPGLERIFANYEGEFVGLCYDCGHGNMEGSGRTGLDKLDKHKDRLAVTHLHDNDGVRDQHDLAFSGAVDWERLAGIIAASAYDKCLSFEYSIRNTGIEDHAAFLSKARETAGRFHEMVEQARQ